LGSISSQRYILSYFRTNDPFLTGVNGGLYPDLAKKGTTLNKFHRYIDMSPCPYVLRMPSLHSLLAL